MAGSTICGWMKYNPNLGGQMRQGICTRSAWLLSPLQVLSHSTFDCRGAGTSTQSVYYTTPSGAGVFTAGTLRWGCALVDRCERPLGRATRRFAQRVTANVIRAFARGPVGLRHPATDNVADFDLPLLNGVSAS